MHEFRLYFFSTEKMGNQQVNKTIEQSQPSRTRQHLFQKGRLKSCDWNMSELNGSQNGNQSRSIQAQQGKRYLSLVKQNDNSRKAVSCHKDKNHPKINIKGIGLTSASQSRESSLIKKQTSQSYYVTGSSKQRVPIRPRELSKQYSQKLLRPYNSAQPYVVTVPVQRLNKVCYQRTNQHIHTQPIVVANSACKPMVKKQPTTIFLYQNRISSYNATQPTITITPAAPLKLKKVALARSEISDSPLKQFSLENSQENSIIRGQSAKSIYVQDKQNKEETLFTNPKLFAYINEGLKKHNKTSSSRMLFATATDLPNPYIDEIKASICIQKPTQHTISTNLEELGVETKSTQLIQEINLMPTLTEVSQYSKTTSTCFFVRNASSGSEKVIQMCRPQIDPGVMADLLQIPS